MIPCIDHFKCVDLRTVSFDVPPQEVSPGIVIYNLLICLHSSLQILTRDSVTVSVDAVVYFNVIDAELALCSVDDFRFVYS